jgi:hypothetical protein
MKIVKRAAIIVGGVVAFWFALLLVLDVALAGRQTRLARERLAESLKADVTIGDADLALVRGRLAIDHLAAHRDDTIGHLAIDVPAIRCELPPLGLALFDGECRELAIRGARLQASAAALFRLAPPKHAPARARRVVIDDARLEFSPSALVPSLGRVAIAIDHADAGTTVFRTPLSFLFALDELRARIELPGDASLRVGYRDGVLEVAGALFGATPVRVPLELPRAAAASDGATEIDLLVALGKDVAERLVAKRAADWLRSKLPR